MELVNGFRDKSKLPGLVWLSRLEHLPLHPKVAALIPGQGTVGVGGGGGGRGGGQPITLPSSLSLKEKK